jgi:hypothetical protein
VNNLALLWEGNDPATMRTPFAPGVLFYAIVADAPHLPEDTTAAGVHPTKVRL